MVGRELAERPPGEQVAPGEPLLTVDRLTREGVFTDISFTVRAGEIVALAGLVGSGRSEVARAIFGIDRYDAGAVTVRGQRLRRGSPTGAMAAGVGFVPEDRRQQGLVMDMSVQQNVALASLGRLRRGGLIRASAERALAADWGARLTIKYGRLKDPVSMLSGGNQQKVVLAKWLGRKPAVLIVDEPTRGIDVATKAEVHHLLVQLARDGVGVLMISSELPEVLQISDRILVMREGRLMTELAHADASEEKILAAATGQAAPGRGQEAGASERHAGPRAAPPAPAGEGARKLTERAFRARESGILVVLVVFVTVTWSVQHRFLNSTNIQFILVNTTVFALLALGETMVVISRNYDLSVGSVLGLSAYLSASLFGQHHGIPIPLVFLAGLGIGLGCGLLNGLMVSVGRVPSLVVTLATLYIFRGIDILIVGGKEVVANSLPSSFTDIPKATVLGIPDLAIVIAVVIAIGAYYLRVVPLRPGAVRDGIQPGRRAAGRDPGRPARVRRVHGERRHRGGRRGAVGGAVRHHRLDRGHRLRAPGGVRRRGRRGGDLRRERQRGRRGARRAAAQHDQLRALRAGHLAVLGPGDLGFPAHPGDRPGPVHRGPADRRAAAEEDPPCLSAPLLETLRPALLKEALRWETGLARAGRDHRHRRLGGVLASSSPASTSSTWACPTARSRS